MPREFKEGCFIKVTYRNSKHFNRTGVVTKVGKKKITVRFACSNKGFIWFDHAKIIDPGFNTPDNSKSDNNSDRSVNSVASERSLIDSEGRFNVDEDGWPPF